MAKDTKERILAAALEQFSQNGYAGTNIRELTASLGLVKSAMYKHFESKEDIWNTLLDEMIVYYDEHFGSSDHLPPLPDSLEGLAEMTMQMVDFTVHDEKVVKTRKLLTILRWWHLPILHRSPHSSTCATGSRRKQRRQWRRSKHSYSIFSVHTG